MTHVDFVAGVRDGTIGFKCIGREPHQLLCGARSIIFVVLLLLYMAAPFILVPLWSWHVRSGWFLFGIPASWAGTNIAAQLIYRPQKQNSFGALLLIAFVALWIFAGFHSIFTFLTVCAFWGALFFMISENVEREYAMQSLIENAQLFDKAVARNWIEVVCKDDLEQVEPKRITK